MAPVSAARMAAPMEMASRISPTSTRSGSSRRALLRARLKLMVSRPTSRCSMTHCSSANIISTGSSMVMMWRRKFLFKCITMAAMVVDLPEPVMPASRVRPRLASASLRQMGLMPSFSMGGRSFLMYRMAIAHLPVWEKTFTRNRPNLGLKYEKSTSRSFLKSSTKCSGHMLKMTRSIHFLVGLGKSRSRKPRLMRKWIFSSSLMWRSATSSFTASCRMRSNRRKSSSSMDISGSRPFQHSEVSSEILR